MVSINKVSLPPRGAWIEINIGYCFSVSGFSRSPHGERGLKFLSVFPIQLQSAGRSPHGERGLKCADLV